jgi:hypothetical protein
MSSIVLPDGQPVDPAQEQLEAVRVLRRGAHVEIALVMGITPTGFTEQHWVMEGPQAFAVMLQMGNVLESIQPGTLYPAIAKWAEQLRIQEATNREVAGSILGKRP